MKKNKDIAEFPDRPEGEQPEGELLYAGFNGRMIAAMIDLALIMLVAIFVIEGISYAVFGPFDPMVFAKVVAQPNVETIPVDKLMLQMFQVMRESQVFERFILQSVLQIAAVGLYMIPLWLRYSSTPGKMLLRMEIRDERTGERMSKKQVWMRFFGYLVSSIPLTLGFMWIMFTKKRQGWHDRIAGTVVVRRAWRKKEAAKEVEPNSAPPSANP